MDEAGILEAYVGALQESQYDCAELVRVHTLTDKATHTLNARSVVPLPPPPPTAGPPRCGPFCGT